MIRFRLLVAAAALAGTASPAAAQLVVSQLITHLGPSSRTADILVFNDSDERSYVSIEPREIVNPGTPEETSVTTPDPRVLGLLLSSTRLVLEPRQKRLLRLAATSLPLDRERVYRVVVKPVVGDVESPASGLKLLVGYELLVLVRSAKMGRLAVDARRVNNQLILTNRGTSSVELLDGSQCAAGGGKCAPLASKRLYAGAGWSQPVTEGGRIEYRVLSDGKTQLLKF